MTDCCISPTYEEIQAAVVSARQRTDKVSTTIVNDLFYQYGYCERPEHHVLQLYAEAADSHLNQLSAGIEPCLCCEEIRNVVEGIRSIVGVFCSCTNGTPELEVDKSQFTAWATEHPDCVPYKTWEAAIYAECNRRGLTIVAEALDLTCQKVVMHKRATEVLCKIPHNKKVEALVCDFELNIKPIPEECKIAYGLLPEDITCQISVEKFAALQNCGVSIDIIAQTIACGLGFDITPEGVTVCETGPETVSAILGECCDFESSLQIFCPPDAEFLCIEDVPTILDYLPQVTTEGGCGEVVVSPFFQSESGTCPRIIIRQYRAEDECGTIVQCTQNITVDDTGVPESGCAEPCV